MGIPMLNPARSYLATGIAYTLAAEIEGKLPPAPTPPPAEGEEKTKEDAKPDGTQSAHVILIADLDMISDTFFDLRQRPTEAADFS